MSHRVFQFTVTAAALLALYGCAEPKASDTLGSAASWSAMAGEVVTERADGALTRPFTTDALGVAADGLDGIATQLDSAADLDAATRQAASRDARARAADARRLARASELGEVAARPFTTSAERFRAIAEQRKAAERRSPSGGSP